MSPTPEHQPPGAKLRALRWMRKTWPAAFSIENPRPLAIGTFHRIAEQLPADISKTAVRRALGEWTRRARYQRALAAGGPRFTLDGKPWGTITDEQARNAKAPGDEPGASNNATMHKTIAIDEIALNTDRLRTAGEQPQ